MFFQQQNIGAPPNNCFWVNLFTNNVQAININVYILCVSVCVYLCAGMPWRRGVVVRAGDRQVVAAALPPQTLDVERRFPTWLGDKETKGDSAVSSGDVTAAELPLDWQRREQRNGGDHGTRSEDMVDGGLPLTGGRGGEQPPPRGPPALAVAIAVAVAAVRAVAIVVVPVQGRLVGVMSVDTERASTEANTG